jgi:hypothetical protein
MRGNSDTLHEILREFLAEEKTSDDHAERLSAYLAGEAYTHASRANPERPSHASRYGRYKTANLLSLCAAGDYQTAWGRFKELKAYLEERTWMGLFDGDLYLLGAAIARRAGEGGEALGLEQAYRNHQARYVNSFGARAVEALMHLWARPEVLEALDEVLAPGLAGIGEHAALLARLLRKGAQAEAVSATASIFGSLLDVWEHVRGFFPRALTVSNVAPVPAGVGAFAGIPRERFRVQAVREDGRLTVVAWETDAGELRVDVQTPEADDHGRTVRVVLLGEGEPLVVDIAVERYVFEGQPYGSVGRWVGESFAEQAARLGRECAVVAAFLEEEETERSR